MRRRRLGSNGPWVGALGLGCMGMSGVYGPADRGESMATIHAAIDVGVNLIDTGDFYGSGHNELLIAEALKGRPRDDFLLSVKFGALRDPSGAFVGYDARPAAVRNFLGLQPAAARRRPYRHLPARPARSRRADRGDDRRDRRHGESRLCPAHRPVGSRRRDDPARRRRPPDRRPANRIFADRARDRGGDPAGLPRTRRRRHRLWRAARGA